MDPSDRAQIEHLVRTLLRRQADTPLERAIIKAEITTRVLIQLSKKDYKNLKYINDDDTDGSNLNDGDATMLNAAKYYIKDKAMTNINVFDKLSTLSNRNSLDEWTINRTAHNMSSQEEYDPVRMKSSVTTVPGVAAQGTRTTTSAASLSPAENFKKGIKRDQSLFTTTLTDAKHWDAFSRDLKIQCHAQEMSDVIDSSFKPTTKAAKELFKIKQAFMFAVLNRLLQTDQGKTTLRRYTDTFDARQVYLDLVEYHTKSVSATIEINEILRYLTTTKFTDGKWKGTINAYILHWFDQLRQFHDLAPKEQHFEIARWKQLTADSKKVWDQLPDDQKALLLGNTPSAPSSNATVSTMSLSTLTPPVPSPSVHFRDPPSDSDFERLLVSMTSGKYNERVKSVPPSDPRRLFAQKPSSKTP